MNSGELDLKTRWKVSFAPLDAGAERIPIVITGAARATSLTKPVEAPASGATQISKTERSTEFLIVSVGCGIRAFALRFAESSAARATREALRAISGQGG